MNRILITALSALLTVFSGSMVWAQEDELKGFPGYVDFGELGSIFGEPTVEIAVGKGLLGLISALSASEEPEVAKLFSRLEGVRVRVFETDRMAEGAIDYIKDVSAALSSKGWEAVVTVNSADEQVRIFMKMKEDIVEGLTVMALEEHEAAFINVIGFLRPEELAEVMDRLDVDLDHDDDDHDEDDDGEG